jgi:hypothetical protein
MDFAEWWGLRASQVAEIAPADGLEPVMKLD